MIDWFWYFVGCISGIFGLIFVLWLYDKLGLIKFEMRICEGDRFKHG